MIIKMRTKGLVFFTPTLVLINVMLTVVLAQNNTDKVTDGDSSQTDNQGRPIDQALEPLYTMTNTFLDLVQPESKGTLPQFFESLGAHNASQVLEVFGDIQNNWQVWTTQYIGFTICVAIGILFIIIMPIVGCCICCCRCCCKNCGGRVPGKQQRNDKCCRISCGVVLLILNTVMLAGMVCTFMSNEMLREQTDHSPDNKRAVLPSLVTELDSGVKYLNNTVQEVLQLVDKVDTKLDGVVTTLKNVPTEATKLVGQKTDTQDVLDQAENLGNSLETIKNNLQTISSTRTNLVNQYNNNLKPELDSIKSDTTSALNQCTGSSQECRNLKASFDSLQAAEFDKLPTVDSQKNQIDTIFNAGLKDMIADGKKQYEDIAKEVENTAKTNLDDVEAQVSDVKTQVRQSSMQVTSLITNLTGGQLNDVTKQIKQFGNDVTTYGNYRWYAGIALGCILLLVIFLYYLGLCFGACGDPFSDATCSRFTGGNILVAGVVFTFLFSWLLMLITFLFFSVGGVLYTEGCRHLVKMEDTPVLADTLDWVMGDQPLPANLDVRKVLSNCKDNQGLYQAANIDQLFNLTAKFNLDQYEVRDAVAGLKDLNFDIQPVEILSANTKSELNRLKDAGLQDIDIAKFETLLTNGVVSTDINALSAQMQTAIDAVTDPLKTDLQTQKNKLDKLNTDVIEPMKTQTEELQNAVSSLKSQVAGQDAYNVKVENLIQALEAAENNINSEAETIVKEYVSSLAQSEYDDMKLFLDQLVNDLQNNVGKCKPMYDVLENTVDIVCVNILNPFNGFWFSIGLFLFFSTIAFILALKQADLYRRDDNDDFDAKSFDDPNFEAYQGYHPSDTIPLEDVNRHKRQAGRSGHPNPSYERDDYTRSGHHRSDYPRPSYPSSNGATSPGGGYDRGGGYGDRGYDPNPPHYYNNYRY